jgi:hypothetical protein
LRGCRVVITDGGESIPMRWSSAGMIYIPSFMKIGKDVQNFLRGIKVQREK